MEAKKHKITVVGSGYVGFSQAVLLATKYEVTCIDIDPVRVQMINSKISPIKDELIEKYLKEKKLYLNAEIASKAKYQESEIIIIAAPTDYNEKTNSFDTNALGAIVKDILAVNQDAIIVIKSTVPIGYTKRLSELHNFNKLLFSPEFLREGKALYDNLYPSRIVVGGPENEAKTFGAILRSVALREDVDVMYTDMSAAEAIKLFSNTYLAMRVAYFNEVDTYCVVNKLNTREVVEGISKDPRIGEKYNNPSFGYGGYCLPKDTRQLLTNYGQVPQKLIGAIVEANEIRKKFIANEVIELVQRKRRESESIPVVGVYRITMKSGSDNFRQSAVIDIMHLIHENGIEILIYEPEIKANNFEKFKIQNDLNLFKEKATLVLANRDDSSIYDIQDKIICRDIFGNDD